MAQAHATSRNAGVSAARPDDLLAILADLQGRADRLRAQVSDLQLTERRLNAGTAGTLASLKITVRESPVAWAAFEGPLG